MTRPSAYAGQIGRTLVVDVYRDGDQFVARCEQLPAWRFGPVAELDRVEMRRHLLAHQSKHTSIQIFFTGAPDE